MKDEKYIVASVAPVVALILIGVIFWFVVVHPIDRGCIGCVFYNEPVPGSGLDPSFAIQMKDIDGTFKDEFVKQINNFKTMREDNGDYWMEVQHKISDITEFYCLDNLKIDGYRLYLVSVLKGVIRYNFVPVEQWDNEYVISNGDGVIEIKIYRLENIFESPTAEELLKNRRKSAYNGYLTEDGMLYYPEHNRVSAIFDDTFFTIKAPKSFNIVEELSKHDFIDISEIDLPEDYEFVDEYAHLGTYESLRELAFRVIETAELVVVR